MDSSRNCLNLYLVIFAFLIHSVFVIETTSVLHRTGHCLCASTEDTLCIPVPLINGMGVVSVRMLFIAILDIVRVKI